jgi:hypothetical protein
VTTYGAESWTQNKDVDEQLATLKKKLIRMFVVIKVTENWRKRYNKKINAVVLKFRYTFIFRIIWLNWIGHVNRMDSKIKVGQVFYNNKPRGSRQRR